MESSSECKHLTNGIRFSHIHTPGRKVEYLVLAIEAGSRDETRQQHGLAHFVEHSIFKGTESRSSLEILNTMEELGGELNAFTTKEETVVYTTAPSGNILRAASLLADLVMEPTFPTEELDKERQVVADEIDSYEDVPGEIIFDDFEDMLFKGSSLGHPILGTKRSIEKYDFRWCIRWIRTHFIPRKMAVVYMGPASERQINDILNKTIGHIADSSLSVSQSRIIPPVNPRFITRLRKNCHQSHILIGRRAPGRYEKGAMAWALMSNILGGPGMNSLLNVALREKQGLVYNVEATSSALSDCGLFTIYFGCDHNDEERCLDIVDEVVGNLRKNIMTERELRKAQQQMAGQMTVSLEIPIDIALGAARSLLRYGHVKTIEERIKAVMDVGREELAESIEKIGKEEMSMLILR